MIELRALAWLRKPVGMVVAAVVGLAVLWWAYSAITGRLRTEAKLGRNQAEAAASSGADAVNVVGAAGVREGESADLTRSNNKEIRNAPGANATVAPPVRDAGLGGLCKRDAYKLDPKCVQHPRPR